MNAPARRALELRRQVLLATIALQRFELGSHVGSMRVQARTFGRAARLLRVAMLAVRWWGVGQLAWRLAVRAPKSI